MPSTVPPPNFSWVIPNKLAAHGYPSEPSEVQYLEEVGIKHVVVLTKECRPPVDAGPNISWCFIDIEDFTPPSLEQVNTFFSVIEKGRKDNEAVSVHCFRGIGRTGTMIACYFVKYEGMTAENAIQKIRQLRPGSIETKDQEDLVTDFYQQMKSIEAERR